MTPKEAYLTLINRPSLSEEKTFNLECIIAEDSSYSFNYARYVLKGRFELGEGSISKDSENSCSYAYRILKGRFKIGEEVIAKSPSSSLFYAERILHGRFLLGEKTLSNHPTHYSNYIQFLQLNNLAIP